MFWFWLNFDWLMCFKDVIWVLLGRFGRPSKISFYHGIVVNHKELQAISDH